MAKLDLTQKLTFSLRLKEVPVEVEKADGVASTYTLRELTGKQRDHFLQELSKRSKFVNGRPTGQVDLEGLQSELLTMCLFDSSSLAVKVDELQNFPAHVLSTLFKAAQQLSGLDEAAVDEAKND